MPRIFAVPVAAAVGAGCHAARLAMLHEHNRLDLGQGGIFISTEGMASTARSLVRPPAPRGA